MFSSLRLAAVAFISLALSSTVLGLAIPTKRCAHLPIRAWDVDFAGLTAFFSCVLEPRFAMDMQTCASVDMGTSRSSAHTTPSRSVGIRSRVRTTVYAAGGMK